MEDGRKIEEKEWKRRQIDKFTIHTFSIIRPRALDQGIRNRLVILNVRLCV